MKQEFNNKAELFRYLIDNKEMLIAEKKFEMKKADAFRVVNLSVLYGDEEVDKAAVATTDELLKQDSLKAKIVINTTGLYDSHGDVHIEGLWKKTLREQKNLYHLQEHVMGFSHIISDNVKAYTRSIPWRDLGYEAEGNTEALVFESEIQKVRNPFMFDQYARGYVKNHSVGMRYVQLQLCVNSKDEDYKKEKENWDKYIDQVINRKDVEEKGFFWAVTEAKLLEGSAVPVGSNYVTPTISIKSSEPSEDTQAIITGPTSSPTHKSLFDKIGRNLKN